MATGKKLRETEGEHGLMAISFIPSENAAAQESTSVKS